MNWVLISVPTLRIATFVEARNEDVPMTGLLSKSTSKIIMLMAFAILASATSALPAQAAWAIAIVEGASPSIVSGSRSLSNASAQAVQDCNAHHNTNRCKVIAKGRRGCFALANTDRAGTKWGVGKSSRRSTAKKSAVSDCEAKHGQSCNLIHDQCE